MVQSELSILEAEIQAFRQREVDIGKLREVVDVLEASASEKCEGENAREWFYTDRVRLGTALATAAGVFLRVGLVEQAQKEARAVLTCWLSFPAAENQDSWTEKIARLPKAIALSVVARASGEPPGGTDYQAALGYTRALPPREKKRYRRLFEYCEVPVG